jgi:hypothetical protein
MAPAESRKYNNPNSEKKRERDFCFLIRLTSTSKEENVLSNLIFHNQLKERSLEEKERASKIGLRTKNSISKQSEPKVTSQFVPLVDVASLSSTLSMAAIIQSEKKKKQNKREKS